MLSFYYLMYCLSWSNRKVNLQNALANRKGGAL